MEGVKCGKCGFLNETFQRGQFITGTRCLSCGYETLAKICKDVGELKVLLEKIPENTAILFQDDLASVKVEVHYVGDMGRTERVKIWRGLDK